jgi:hypothetical protein
MSWRRWLSKAGAALAATAACAAGGPAMAGPVADWNHKVSEGWNDAQNAVHKHLDRARGRAGHPHGKKPDGMLHIQPYRPNHGFTIRDLRRNHWRFKKQGRR